MVHKCTAPECTTSCKSVHKSQLAIFYFPLKKMCLEPTKISVFCDLNFAERFIIKGKIYKLSWSMSPVLTIHYSKLAKTPSVLPTRQTSRSPLRKNLRSKGSSVNCFIKVLLHEVQFRRFKKNVTFYRVKVNEETHFPTIQLRQLDSMKICRSTCNTVEFHFRFYNDLFSDIYKISKVNHS